MRHELSSYRCCDFRHMFSVRRLPGPSFTAAENSVIAGISFEFLRLAGSSDNPVVCSLAKPGLALQGLVTREPDEKMVEVAICAVEKVFDWRKWQGKQ